MHTLRRAATLIFLMLLTAGTATISAQAATTTPAKPHIAAAWPACTPFLEGAIIISDGLYYECKYAEGIGFGWFVVGVEKGCAAVGAPGKLTDARC